MDDGYFVVKPITLKQLLVEWFVTLNITSFLSSGAQLVGVCLVAVATLWNIYLLCFLFVILLLYVCKCVAKWGWENMGLSSSKVCTTAGTYPRAQSC